ncbi:MAG: polysaccharide deacetylase family protein [Candidatus Falkowbacteria bacterium]
MCKVLWINFLHLYQPATVDNETVIEATEKSYTRIIRALIKNPDIKFTLNIAGCLVERWEKLGYEKLIKDIKKLIENNQVELTGSAAYHAFLPLLPKNEAERQIKLNEKILKKYFGENLKLNGFFIPEAAYSKDVAKIIKKLGYKWILLDEISLGEKNNEINYFTKYIDKNSGIFICFRSRDLSKSYVPQTIFDIIMPRANVNKNKLEPKIKNKIAITATDAELYGLRHNDISRTFEKLLEKDKIKTALISEHLNNLKRKKIIKPIASSWESTEEELKKNLPYHLWYNKKNKIQKNLWKLANFAIKSVCAHKDDENYQWARLHLDKGLSSCTFWWASAKDFRLFGSISWSPDEIERGTNELIRSIRAIENVTARKTKIKAEKLYIKIKTMVWQNHWKYYWKNQ